MPSVCHGRCNRFSFLLIPSARPSHSFRIEIYSPFTEFNNNGSDDMHTLTRQESSDDANAHQNCPSFGMFYCFTSHSMRYDRREYTFRVSFSWISWLLNDTRGIIDSHQMNSMKLIEFCFCFRFFRSVLGLSQAGLLSSRSECSYHKGKSSWFDAWSPTDIRRCRPSIVNLNLFRVPKCECIMYAISEWSIADVRQVDRTLLLPYKRSINLIRCCDCIAHRAIQ